MDTLPYPLHITQPTKDLSSVPAASDRLPKYLPYLPQTIGQSGEHGPHPPTKPSVYAWQIKWEFEQLLDLYVMRRPARVLELGTAGGGTLYWWLHHARPEATIVSVDTYSPDRGWYGSKDNRHLYPEWNVHHNNLVPIQGHTCSRDTLNTLQVKGLTQFDWVFIDAGHTYTEVKLEWETYKPMVAPGGVLILHDIHSVSDGDSICGVNKLWREIQAKGYLTQEVVAVPGSIHTFGTGIVYL